MESVEAWITVRRYCDLEGSTSLESIPASAPQSIILSSNLGFVDLKSQIRVSIGLAKDGNEVLKLRRSDGILLPFSFLLDGNTRDTPYIVDVSRVNQNGAISARSALPPSYGGTVRSQLSQLQSRVDRVEALVPEMQSRRRAALEHTLHQLGSKVNFLDQRVDHLLPLDWKQHLQLTSA